MVFQRAEIRHFRLGYDLSGLLHLPRLRSSCYTRAGINQPGCEEKNFEIGIVYKGEKGYEIVEPFPHYSSILTCFFGQYLVNCSVRVQDLLVTVPPYTSLMNTALGPGPGTAVMSDDYAALHIHSRLLAVRSGDVVVEARAWTLVLLQLRLVEAHSHLSPSSSKLHLGLGKR